MHTRKINNGLSDPTTGSLTHPSNTAGFLISSTYNSDKLVVIPV